MLKLNNTGISQITLQRVGNKVNQELSLSTSEVIPLSENEEEQLRTFFLSSIKSQQEVLKFTHHISLDYNTVYDNTCKLWNQEIGFIEYSNHLLNHLYEKSNHPQIKTGELFIAHFQGIQFEEITVDGIGIFKIENQVNFLKFQYQDDDLDFIINKGVKLQKIDKGCLILNSEISDGLRVISIDNNNYDANYWKKDFLGLTEVVNEAYQTKHHLQMLTSFSNTLNEEKDSYTQKEFMSQGIKLFQENEVITKNLLEDQLLSPFDVVDSYSSFKQQYHQEHNVDLQEDFQVAPNILKKEKRKIKNLINLDTNIQIKLDLSHADDVKDNVEKGFDEERKMYYYKVYYNEEM